MRLKRRLGLSLRYQSWPGLFEFERASIREDSGAVRGANLAPGHSSASPPRLKAKFAEIVSTSVIGEIFDKKTPALRAGVQRIS
jgi:hypothetical protein